MDLRQKLNQLPNRVLYVNLMITQGILFLIGVVLYFIFLRKSHPIPALFHFDEFGLAFLIGSLFAVFVVCLDLILMKWLPKGYFDDGGINERIFRDIGVLQIAIIALFVSIVEEWLFRAALQNMIGLFWASLLFALLHYRYLHKWFYGLLVIAISFGFGILYDWTGSLWSVIVAHFWIDFILGCMIRYRKIDFANR